MGSRRDEREIAAQRAIVEAAWTTAIKLCRRDGALLDNSDQRLKGSRALLARPFYRAGLELPSVSGRAFAESGSDGSRFGSQG